MKKLSKFLITAALLTATFTPVTAQEADEKALREVSRKFTAAWNSGDATALAALYAQDAVLTMPGGTTSRGRQGIQAAAAADLRDKKGSKIAFSAEEFRPLSPDSAVWRCEWKLTGLPGGTTATGTGLAVLVKHATEWHIVEDLAALTPTASATPKAPGDHGHDHGPGTHSHDH